jgi:hypothetical protein
MQQTRLTRPAFEPGAPESLSERVFTGLDFVVSGVKYLTDLYKKESNFNISS